MSEPVPIRAARPTPPSHAKVSYSVRVDSAYPLSPYEVAIVIRAASPDAALAAVDEVFSACEGQLTQLKKSGWMPRG